MADMEDRGKEETAEEDTAEEKTEKETEKKTEKGMQEELSLEQSFDKLDSLLERLEDRDLPLEDAFDLYQQGMTLMKQCNEKIDTVEKKILVMNGDGNLDEF